jgi:putative oxidoreductase
MLMLSAGQRDLIRDKGTILGRALIGLLFFASGLTMAFTGGASYLAGAVAFLGPLAIIAAWIAVLLKIVAGAAIIIGVRVGLASASLVVFILIATIIAHMNWSDPMQITATLKNLAIIGGLLYLMAYGPGGANTTRLSNGN